MKNMSALLRFFLLAITISSALLASFMNLQDLEGSATESEVLKVIPRPNEHDEYFRRSAKRSVKLNDDFYFENDSTNQEGLQALFGLLIFIEAICKHALAREDSIEYGSKWLSAIIILGEEASNNYLLSNGESDKLFYKRIITFRKSAKNKENDCSDSDSSYGAKIHCSDDADYFSKSKMVKDDCIESDENYEVNEERKFADLGKSCSINEGKLKGGNIIVERADYSDNLDEKNNFMDYKDFNDDNDDKEYRTLSSGDKGYNTSSSDDIGGFQQLMIRDSRRNTAKKTSFRHRRLISASNMSTAKEVEVDNSSDMKVITKSDADHNMETMIDRLKEELLERITREIQAKNEEQAARTNPRQEEQLAQFTSNLQDGRELADYCDLPEMNSETLIEFLRTSALPKLLNSLVKEKTGVNVLKDLSMALRVLNESLGVAEIIFKILMKMTRTSRYYILFASKVVAEMAEEDNLRPLVDLSVSIPTDSMSMTNRYKRKQNNKFGFSGIKRKLFRKKMKSSKGLNDPDEIEDEESDPFTLSIDAIISCARGKRSKLKQLPRIILLKLIHTIFAELEKRDGVIRVALTGKKIGTLFNLQDSIKAAIESIYEAVIQSDSTNYSEQLTKLSPKLFAEIIFAMISPVKLDQNILDAHITLLTERVKPLMAIFGQEAQLNILEFMLSEDMDDKSSSIFVGSKKNRAEEVADKKIMNWTSSDNYK